MSQTVPMTPEGYQRLQEELKHLIRVERPRVVQDIAEARDHGDLSENAEYDAAKERQGFIEGRMRELETKLSRAEVIDVATISPLDIDTILESIAKTGRLVIVHEAARSCGVGAERGARGGARDRLGPLERA